MKQCNSNIYFIPGFGFEANIFYYKKSIIGLNYFDYTKHSLKEIATVLANKIIDDAIVIGWSLGGLIAIQISALFPNKIKKLILLSSQPRFLEDQNWNGISAYQFKWMFKTNQKNAQSFMQYFYRLVNFPNCHMRYSKHLLACLLGYSPTQIHSLLTALLTTDLRTEYQASKVKTLHVIAARDQIINQNTQQLKALNPNIHIHVIKQAGHACFITHNSLLNMLIENFIHHDK